MKINLTPEAKVNENFTAHFFVLALFLNTNWNLAPLSHLSGTCTEAVTELLPVLVPVFPEFAPALLPVFPAFSVLLMSYNFDY